jgi:hypothetical protein
MREQLRARCPPSTPAFPNASGWAPFSAKNSLVVDHGNGLHDSVRGSRGIALQDADPDARRLFLEHHPDAARYADFADFSLFRFDIAAGRMVAGFGRIIALTRAELLAKPRTT